MCCIYACVDSPFPSSIPPFPFKEGMGEYNAAYMRVNLYTCVKQHLKVGLRVTLKKIEHIKKKMSADSSFTILNPKLNPNTTLFTV